MALGEHAPNTVNTDVQRLSHPKHILRVKMHAKHAKTHTPPQRNRICCPFGAFRTYKYSIWGDAKTTIKHEETTTIEQNPREKTCKVNFTKTRENSRKMKETTVKDAEMAKTRENSSILREVAKN